ncbi:hypothetical protein SLE2022_181750 [Rubroshorea leprosula]
MQETGSTSQNAASPVDPTDHLPLSLLRSDAIPAAPDRSASSIDWLPDFAGYSWVAYGSSTLLVITHFPSPLSQEETLIGPIFRQVFELSADPVTAVSWSLVTPSVGELAASSGNCIFIFSHQSASSNCKGSFCWSQNAVLEQCAKVQAIEWTASGDGIVSGGIEVVLWKRRSKSWEIAWKFKPEQPQNLVSATSSIEGPSATAAYWKESEIEESNELTKSVVVCYGDGNSGYAKVMLSHPQPISMIQWRPSTGEQSCRDVKHLPRHILLTCCLDGTVRLWSEVDGGRVKKVGKDSANDQKSIRQSFCVAAVIEINQALNGILGVDISLTWAIEVGGTIKTSKGTNQFFNVGKYKHDMTGGCEWLIGFGPGALVTFWAIHCLDDISPMRFPRVKLWKRQEQKGLEVGLSNFKDQLLLKKVFIMRNCLSGPPALCSLLHLLPCKSLSLSVLYTEKSNDVVDASPSESRAENLSHSVCGVLNMDGHTGKILQVAVHPYVDEVQLTVSLDSSGLLLFWSSSSLSNNILSLPTLIPTWKFCGKLATGGSCSKYTSLRWAPSVLDEDRILLLGHSQGIDCFIVKISKSKENDIACHYVCTVPFAGQGFQDGPADIYSIPLSPSCKQTFMYNRFMLLGIWMRGFQALSWEITIHSYDLGGSFCECNFDDNIAVQCSTLKIEDEFAGRRYCLLVNSLSSQLPEPHNNDQVTSFAVIFPGGLTPVHQKLAFNSDPCSESPAYTMATGCSDGSLKLWRCNCSKLPTSHTQWELVGMFVAHHGPVSAICLTDCGRKIATISKENQSSSAATCTLCIWDSIHLADSGSFLLEDTLSLDRDVVALNWLALGNGQLVLGVCLKSELQIYALRHFSSQALFNSKNSLETHVWFCIAVGHTSPDIHNFLWGHGAAAVAVHTSYLSIFSPWLFLLDKKCWAKSYPYQFKENLIDCEGGAQLKCQSDLILGFWSMVDIAEILWRSLPVYHPEALFLNIYSGNWKRAHASLRHLVEYLTSNYASKRRDCSSKGSSTVPQMLLSDYFEGLFFKSSNENGFQWSGNAMLMMSSSQYQSGLMQFAYNSAPNSSSNIFSSSSTKPELGNFLEPLEKLHELAAVTNTEKMQILTIIDLLNEVSNPHSASAYGNLDEPGQRFWVTIRFQQLHFSRRFGRSASLEELVIDSGLIAWASHSDCQESLFASILPNEPTWQEMRTLGVGFWFSNAIQLRTRMEKLARLQYLKKKDPKDCTLLYVALNRLQVLAGLFKISKDEKDKPLVGFLLRNFQEEKNKEAALKNAYVLMGRHQLELAIAFFLLGGDASSAVTICVKNLGDEQLALVICRLVEGRGGPLEHQLITKFILPSAIDRGDYWLASLLEWELGNYFQSYITMLGFQGVSAIATTTLSCNHVAFKDPSIGLYCFALANKNSMRNAIGDQNAVVLAKWASLMNATALSRSGLPLEALECLSSSQSILKGTDQENTSDLGCSKILQAILKPSASDSSNWLLDDVASNLESHAKLDLALQYISKLIREHPSWPDSYLGSSDSDGTSMSHKDDEIHQYEKLLKNFQYKLYTGLAQFEQKHSLVSSHLINMALVSLCNNGLWFLGYDILYGYLSQGQSQHENHTVDSSLLYLLFNKPLLKAAEDISFLFSHFIAACGMSCPTSNSSYFENDLSGEVCSKWFKALGYYFQGVKHSLWSLRTAIKIFFGIYKKDSILKILTILDLYEYYAHYASAWLQRNSKGLMLMVKPLLITCTNGHTPYEVDMLNMKKLFHQVSDVVFQNRLVEDVVFDAKQGGDLPLSIPEDERWAIIGACLWQHMSLFMKHTLSSVSMSLDENYPSDLFHGKLSTWVPFSANSESDSNIIAEKLRFLSWIMAVVLKTALQHISSYHIIQLALVLQQKLENGFDPSTLVWLEESKPSPSAMYRHLSQGTVNGDITNNTDGASISKSLWDTCADPNIISECFVQEKINWSCCFHLRPVKGWSDLYKSIMSEHETDEWNKNEGRLSNSSASSEVGSPSRTVFRNGHTLVSSWQKDSKIEKEISLFHHPKEVYKRNGELLEALCVNSIDQQQTAIASNRKGIIFFNWEDLMPFTNQSDYIWSDADWPHDGWAGSESTPVPTRVPLGADLGSKKGAHLGLGGAMVGVGSVARPGRDLTGGGAFGVPGYAGIGASGLGWVIQEDFDEFVDPPATVENISTRAFSSHPNRPFFLVGSINTHIYLWEFGKDKATATYGVLPAPNVPPPYALASVSAVQFDHCGHRFATAALDGTVCTWQLEVGGRSNIRPTESSFCFTSHASDVSYVSSSGSVIAAAGYSSNGVNVVIWDTLAPPATSRASIICHDGGARSISVFDNDIGSGSVSPIIVTGGKSGDVGLHDFRYIATGRTKRHRHLDTGEPSGKTSGSDTQNQISDKNLNGMLWYIPKAHSGSITKISTIPNTSLFLTGSKDGDVKLWDAKTAKMVYHWSKLHDRHTFLQPSSRGFGGVVRAAVTDVRLVSHGFLSCGGDGSVKLVQLKDHLHWT